MENNDFNLIKTVYSESKNKFNRAPADNEIASILGISVEEYKKRLVEIINRVVPFCYDQNSIVGILKNYYRNLKQNKLSKNDELKNLIIEEIEELSEKEKQILFLYYYEELTLKEIEKILEITEPSILQLHGKIILKFYAKIINRWSE